MDRGKSARGRLLSGAPNPVDRHVGARIREQRIILGMSQEKLGEAIGLTFQQVQKYENGANRVGASRLYDIARVLRAPVEYFFTEMPDSVANASPALITADTEAPEAAEPDIIHRRESLELLRAYYRVAQTSRQRLFSLVKSMAA